MGLLIPESTLYILQARLKLAFLKYTQILKHLQKTEVLICSSKKNCLLFYVLRDTVWKRGDIFLL